MQLIIAHRTLDFDALAAMVAAKKLYPRAKLVISGKPDPSVREFLALYKDTIPFLRSHQIPRQELTRVIIVDTNYSKQLGDLSWIVDSAQEIFIYDHHPDSNSIDCTMKQIENVGAATTLMVEKLVKENLAISPYEATIFALGIYQDTGSLTFQSTTPRDVRMVAFLLEKGANLQLVGDFMERRLSEEQQDLFNSLINRAEEHWVNGILVLISTVAVENYIGGLAFLTSKLLEITGADSVISLVAMEKKVHLVGRTRVDCVPMNRIMAKFGGGGHFKAAAATVKDLGLDRTYDELAACLDEIIQPTLTAEKIMSHPVKVLSPGTTISEAGKSMLRYGHTGMPVRDEDKLVGMVSRRDVDKALHHGLGHAPVKGFMNRELVTITPQTPLPEIQRMMVQDDIGRLPVVRENKIIGIVSRSDVLRTLHGGDFAHPFNTLYLNQCAIDNKPYLPKLLASHLDVEYLELLKGIGRMADENNWGAYLVGGVVRDVLLGVPNLDFDVVVEGNGPELAAAVAQRYQGRLVVHEKFQTATVVFKDGLKVDFATARKEFYEYPAALPVVEETSLKEDFYRRDFTINAMAAQLAPENFGELLDFFCGYDDLREKRVRILHNISFIEDPTRILRAVRFEQRYGFTIESQTLYVMGQAIIEESLKNISVDRIWTELKLIFNETNAVKIFRRLGQLEIWRQIVPGLEWNRELEGNLERVVEVTKRLQKTGVEIKTWLIYITIILKQIERDKALVWLKELSIAKEYRLFIEGCLEVRDKVAFKELKEHSLKELHILLHNYSEEELAVELCTLKESPLVEQVVDYVARRAVIKDNIAVNGNYLRSLGIKPGPIYAQILFALETAVLAGEIYAEKEQKDFVTIWLKREGVL